MQIRLLQLAVLLICLSGCIDRHTNTPAFYVWKSKLSAEDADTAYLNTLGVQKIYARMFDVDNKGNGAFPTADYSPSSGNPDFQQEVVPVIFITNQTILQCPAADIEKLARNCADRIDTVYRSHFNKLPNEYQFDCDWTVKTKENYFNFLKHIPPQQFGRNLSGDDDKRDGVHVCRRNTCNQVGGARAGSDDADTGFTGHTSVAVGGVSCVLFGTDKNMTDVRLGERVVKGANGSSWIAKDDLYALPLQTGNDCLTHANHV